MTNQNYQTKYLDVYVPEIDGGERLTTDQALMSAYVWLPKHRLPNKDALMEAARVTTVDHKTGAEKVVVLAEEKGEYVVIARHLFSQWAVPLESVIPPPAKYPFVDMVTLRDTQQEAWAALDKADNGVLNLACGKGKTVLALKKVASLQEEALIVVNSTGLMEQWIDRAKEFLLLKKPEIGIVRGPTQQWDRPFVIAMIQTLAKRVEQVPMWARMKFGSIIFDEVHHLSATMFSKSAPLFYGRRYGLTATPEREDGLEPVYFSHVGEVFFSDLEGELTSEVTFKALRTDIPMDTPEIQDRTKNWHITKFYTYLASYEPRNRVILRHVERALVEGRKLVVLSHAKDHPEVLRALGEGSRIIQKRKVGCITGDTKGRDRLTILDESDVTYATFQVAREALDASSLDTVFFITPFAAWGGLQQGKGRIERRKEGKKPPKVIIFDDIKIPPAHNMCKKLRKGLTENGFRFTEEK